jgi:hypothetical protein
MNEVAFREKVTWHRAIFAGGCPPTIVAAVAFHNRVRDGSEWGRYAIDTRKSIEILVDGLDIKEKP